MNKCGHILLASPAAVRACFAMRRFLRENGLSIVTLGLFFLTFIAGQTFFGYREYNSDRVEHGLAPVAMAQYLGSAHFLEATVQNAFAAPSPFP